MWNQPTREMCTSVSKAGAEESPKPLASDMGIQDLELARPGLGLALVQYYLAIPSLLPFVMVTYILCNCTLGVCDLLFNFKGGLYM